MGALCWTTLALSVAGADAQSLRGNSPSKTSDFSIESSDRVVNSSNLSTLLQEQAGNVENLVYSGDRAGSKASENTNDLSWGFNTSKPTRVDETLDALHTMEVLWTENMTEQVTHSGNESETLLQNGFWPWWNPFWPWWNPYSQSPHTCQ